MPVDPATVRQLIEREEKPLRGRDFPAAAVDFVFRYGAMVGAEIVRLDSAGRCMEIVASRIRQCEEEDRSFASGLVVLAAELKRSRGRFQRSWHAPLGGLWLAVGLASTLLPEGRNLLPLAAGVACCECVQDFGVPASIRWVNDVRHGGRKVAGILAETLRGGGLREEYTVLGIGINVNNRDFPPELQTLAGSMAEVLGREVDLDQVAARLLAKLAWNVGLLHWTEAMSLAGDDCPGGHPLLASWRRLQDTLGRRVRFGFNVVSAPLYEATALEIDPSGGLILRLDDGRTVMESAGEILYLS